MEGVRANGATFASILNALDDVYSVVDIYALHKDHDTSSENNKIILLFAIETIIPPHLQKCRKFIFNNRKGVLKAGQCKKTT